MQIEPTQTELEKLRQRLVRLIIIIIIFFMILIVRMSYLQIIKGNYYRKVSENNRIRLIPIISSRGMIYDRNGKVLAQDVPSFDISIIQLGLSEQEILQTLIKLKKIVEIDLEEVKKKILAKKNRPFEPMIIIPDVDRQTLTKVAERTTELPGIIIQVNPKRYYPYGTITAHTLGYLGEISREELVKKHAEGYKYGDSIGKSGIEEYYDIFLRGKDGGKQIEVDARGRQLQVLGDMEPIPGNNLVLTLDRQLQEIASDALGERSGAIVIMNPTNGEILAMVSKPSFDPNIFLRHMTAEQAKRIFADKRYPLFNRDIQALYPPGSVFKVVVAACALENEIIKEATTYSCGGIYWLGNQRFICYHREKHGNMNIIDALAHSCNIFFYQVGYKLGADKISKFAMEMGLGAKTGIDLPSEASGLIPTRDWKKKRYGKSWYGGDTLILSIGQGFVLTTPLQLSHIMSVIVNGGHVYTPRLAKRMIDSSGNIKVFNPWVKKIISLSQQTQKVLFEGLESVVINGTGRNAYLPNLRVAGKTGTVQNPTGEDHALFLCFAPVESPKVVISVVVEHGGKGGIEAVPVARRILEQIDWSMFKEEEKEE
ncbi:MAG: penicillin-binding protein 2 [bacterium]|nr:penicillin-binding protein 2 [bacterium]